MKCKETYYRSGDDWHSYSCDKPARFVACTNPKGERKPVCGVHARRYRRSAAYTVEALA